jgi:hypothetical protein
MVNTFHFYHVVCIVKVFLDVDRWQLKKSRTAAGIFSAFCLWGGDGSVSSDNSMYKTYWNGLYNPSAGFSSIPVVE